MGKVISKHSEKCFLSGLPTIGKNSAAVSGTEIAISFSVTSPWGNFCSLAPHMVRVPASVRGKW